MNKLNLLSEKLKHEKLISIYRNEHKDYEFQDDFKSVFPHSVFYDASNEILGGYIYVYYKILKQIAKFDKVTYFLDLNRRFDNLTLAKNYVNKILKDYSHYEFEITYEVVPAQYPKCIPISTHLYGPKLYIDFLEIRNERLAEVNCGPLTSMLEGFTNQSICYKFLTEKEVNAINEKLSM